MQAIKTYWRRRILGIFLATSASSTMLGCAALLSASKDAGRSFLATLDVGRVLACRGAGDARSAAACVGASVARDGLDVLVDRLAGKLESIAAKTSGAGAQDDAEAKSLKRDVREAEELTSELRALGAKI